MKNIAKDNNQPAYRHVWKAGIIGLLAASWARGAAAASSDAFLSSAASSRVKGAASMPGPHLSGRRLLQCNPTPHVAPFGVTLPLDMSNSKQWVNFHMDSCGQPQGQSDAPLTLTYSAQTAAANLASLGYNYRSLAPTDLPWVSRAFSQMAAQTGIEFVDADPAPITANIIIRLADAYDNDPAVDATPPGRFSTPGHGDQAMVTLVGPAFRSQPAILYQGLATAMGLNSYSAIDNLPQRGPYGGDAMSSVTAAQANNDCYSTTAWGAVDYEAMAWAYGNPQANGSITTFNSSQAAQTIGGESVPYVGGLHKPGQDSAFYIAPGFKQISIALVTDGSLVTQLDNNAYLLSHLSNVTRVTLAGSQGGTLIGNPQPNILVGGAGRDVMDGDGGNDILTGNGGANVMVVNADSGLLTITDFDVHQDKLGLTFSLNPQDVVQTNVGTPQSPRLQLTFPNGKQVQLENVAPMPTLADILQPEFTYQAAAACYRGQGASQTVMRGFTAAPRAPSVTPVSPATTAAPPPGANVRPGHTISMGLIVGAVGGGLATVTATLGVACHLRRRTQATPTLPASAPPLPQV